MELGLPSWPSSAHHLDANNFDTLRKPTSFYYALLASAVQADSGTSLLYCSEETSTLDRRQIHSSVLRRSCLPRIVDRFARLVQRPHNFQLPGL